MRIVYNLIGATLGLTGVFLLGCAIIALGPYNVFLASAAFTGLCFGWSLGNHCYEVWYGD